MKGIVHTKIHLWNEQRVTFVSVLGWFGIRRRHKWKNVVVGLDTWLCCEIGIWWQWWVSGPHLQLCLPHCSFSCEFCAEQSSVCFFLCFFLGENFFLFAVEKYKGISGAQVASAGKTDNPLDNMDCKNYCNCRGLATSDSLGSSSSNLPSSSVPSAWRGAPKALFDLHSALCCPELLESYGLGSILHWSAVDPCALFHYVVAPWSLNRFPEGWVCVCHYPLRVFSHFHMVVCDWHQFSCSASEIGILQSIRRPRSSLPTINCFCFSCSSKCGLQGRGGITFSIVADSPSHRSCDCSQGECSFQVHRLPSLLTC